MIFVKMNQSEIGTNLGTDGINSCTITVIKLDDKNYLMSHFSPFDENNNTYSIKKKIKKKYNADCLIIHSPYFSPCLFFYKKSIETIFNSVDFRVLDYKVNKLENFFTDGFSKNNDSKVEICNHKLNTRLWELEIEEKEFDYFFSKTQKELNAEFKLF